jgi:hypothetical protein
LIIWLLLAVLVLEALGAVAVLAVCLRGQA